jgi:hypothetical protein
MIVEVIDRMFAASGSPLRVTATQVVIYDDNENPIAIAGHYGPDGAYAVARVGDDDFQKLLKAFGVKRHTVEAVTIVQPPVPRGAKLLTPN